MIVHKADVEQPPADQAAPSVLARRMEEFFTERRQITLWGVVDDESSRYLVERLLYLDGQDSTRPITLLIHSPGGSTSAGMAILDAIDLIKAPVATTCIGLACSFGAVLLASGAPGQRRTTPRSRIMIHQPWVGGRIEGRPAEIVRHAREIQNTRDALNRILAERTGQTLAQIEQDTDRDYWMSAEEARAYGLVDEIIAGR